MKNLLQAEVQSEIRTRIAAVSAADTRRWGTLSVTEMMAHVRAAYGIAVPGGEAPAMAGPLPPRLMRFLGLSLPLRWPKMAPTIPQLRREAMPAPESFSVEKQRLEAALEAFLGQTRNSSTHPIFGAMTPADWMRWGYLHADHHLRQFGR